MNLENISKYMCLILRHKPEAIGITLDEHGRANVDELIDGIRKDNPGFDLDHLYEIVETDSKGRYSFNEDKTLIRCNQGHSIPVDVELEENIENYLDLCKQIGKDPERAADYELACRIYTCISDNTDCTTEPEAVEALREAVLKSGKAGTSAFELLCDRIEELLENK